MRILPLLGLLSLAFPVRAEPATWSKPVPIPDRKAGTAPSIAGDGDRVHIVYRGRTKRDLYHSVYAQGAWSAERKLRARSSSQPAAACAAGDLHVVHRGERNKNLYHLMFADGAWTTSRQLPIGKSRTAPAVAATSDAVHVVHPGDRKEYLYHATYRDGRWEERQIPERQSLDAPALAVLDGTVYMVYLGRKSKHLYWATYANGRWSAERKIGGVLGRGEEKASRPPALAAHGKKLHLVYARGETGQLHHLVFTNGAWGPTRKLNGMATVSAPSLAVTTKPQPTLHLAYRDGKNTLWHATRRLAKRKPKKKPAPATDQPGSGG